jgi:hypothetical protein
LYNVDKGEQEEVPNMVASQNCYTVSSTTLDNGEGEKWNEAWVRGLVRRERSGRGKKFLSMW